MVRTDAQSEAEKLLHLRLTLILPVPLASLLCTDETGALGEYLCLAVVEVRRHPACLPS